MKSVLFAANLILITMSILISEVLSEGATCELEFRKKECDECPVGMKQLNLPGILTCPRLCYNEDECTKGCKSSTARSIISKDAGDKPTCEIEFRSTTDSCPQKLTKFDLPLGQEINGCGRICMSVDKCKKECLPLTRCPQK